MRICTLASGFASAGTRWAGYHPIEATAAGFDVVSPVLESRRKVAASSGRRGWSRMNLLGVLGSSITNRKATGFDLRMMRRAIELARAAATADEVPVGAVVYRGEEIVGEGFNLRECRQDPTAHAEIIAIRQAADAIGDWRLSECSIAVTLEPCPMCAGALVNARMGRLVYGAADPKAGAVDTLFRLCTDRRLNHRIEVIPGVLAPECRGLLREFFKERRRINREKRMSPDE